MTHIQITFFSWQNHTFGDSNWLPFPRPQKPQAHGVTAASDERLTLCALHRPVLAMKSETPCITYNVSKAIINMQCEAPPVISWFRFAPVTIVVSTINHSYWSYKLKLRYLGGITLWRLCCCIMLVNVPLC